MLFITVAVACDTGDGRELRPPTAPAPATSAPGFDDGGELTDEPLPTVADRRFEVFAAWRDGALIDTRHTCDGDNISPALTWTGVPDGTVELAVLATDDDTGGLVHWLVTRIDPSVVSTFEGAAPAGGVELVNSFGETGWSGPCPPEGSTHTYRFTVYALNQQLEVADEFSADEVIEFIDLTTIESATITGTSTR
jgi:Raf kinase inhibitor-like YbhB/YbcL family protein